MCNYKNLPVPTNIAAVSEEKNQYQINDTILTSLPTLFRQYVLVNHAVRLCVIDFFIIFVKQNSEISVNNLM